MNHFIELQEDVDTGFLCIMIHSGSRHFGNAVGRYYNAVARTINQKYFSSVPDKWELAFLPMDETGNDYITWMNVALEFARENRSRMMYSVMDIVRNHFEKYAGINLNYNMNDFVNAHHNYADIEHHFGEDVWVHRKGAIRMRQGDMGIIPGAMGSYSYIVEGLGNQDSFASASHGAGRQMGREEALRTYTTEQVVKDLREREVTIGKASMADVADESIWAYKNIEEVIGNEADLAKPVRKLKTVCVIKG
jgi:tRNA-splicing ligase RtcB